MDQQPSLTDRGFGGGRRVLFCTRDEHLLLLHGFVKKSQKTPQSELDIAVKRMKEYDDGENKRLSSSFEFLKEEGVYELSLAAAVKNVLVR